MEDKNYNQIKNIINNSITSMLHEIDNSNIKYKTTILKRIINETISEYQTGSVSLSSKVSTTFSGRGRAWCKVEKSTELFHRIINKLTSYNSNNSNINTTNLIDLFNYHGFAWMRYSGSNKDFITFNLRYLGSKLEESIKFKINYTELSQIKNLEGVPHKINLESGNFKEESNHKVLEEIPVSSEELNVFGIQLIEDFKEEADYWKEK